MVPYARSRIDLGAGGMGRISSGEGGVKERAGLGIGIMPGWTYSPTAEVGRRGEVGTGIVDVEFDKAEEGLTRDVDVARALLCTSGLGVMGVRGVLSCDSGPSSSTCTRTRGVDILRFKPIRLLCPDPSTGDTGLLGASDAAE